MAANTVRQLLFLIILEHLLNLYIIVSPRNYGSADNDNLYLSYLRKDTVSVLSVEVKIITNIMAKRWQSYILVYV